MTAISSKIRTSLLQAFTGNWVVQILLGLWIYQETRSTLAIALYASATALPSLFYVQAGRLTDRLGYSFSLKFGQTGLCISYLAMLFAVFFKASIFFIYGIAFFQSMAGVLFSVAKTAWLLEESSAGSKIKVIAEEMLLLNGARFIAPIIALPLFLFEMWHASIIACLLGFGLQLRLLKTTWGYRSIEKPKNTKSKNCLSVAQLLRQPGMIIELATVLVTAGFLWSINNLAPHYLLTGNLTGIALGVQVLALQWGKAFAGYGSNLAYHRHWISETGFMSQYGGMLIGLIGALLWLTEPNPYELVILFFINVLAIATIMTGVQGRINSQIPAEHRAFGNSVMLWVYSTTNAILGPVLSWLFEQAGSLIYFSLVSTVLSGLLAAKWATRKGWRNIPA